MASIAKRLEEIAEGCDDCAADNLREGEQTNDMGRTAEARAWRATAQMIRSVIADLGGSRSTLPREEKS